jgi:hypothetical protein
MAQGVATSGIVGKLFFASATPSPESCMPTSIDTVRRMANQVNTGGRNSATAHATTIQTGSKLVNQFSRLMNVNDGMTLLSASDFSADARKGSL